MGLTPFDKHVGAFFKKTELNSNLEEAMSG